MLYFFLVLVGLVALAYWFIPPGNFLHEGVRLPFWLWNLRRLENPNLSFERIRYGQHARQYICHHHPMPGSIEKDQLIVYIHGSGWQFGRPEMFNANAQWLTSQGYHAYFISHRRIPSCDIRELREDVALAFGTIKENVEKNGLSPKKIILCGNSAGGNLAALALLDKQVLASKGHSSDQFAAIALFAAPLDLDAMWPSPPLLMVTNWKKKEVYDLANPICHLEESVKIPVLIVHGNKDGIVEFATSTNFYKKLVEKGGTNIRFECLQNGLHLDSASWCFPNHPSSVIFKNWLESLESK